MPDHLVITSQPGSSVTAGQTFEITVDVEGPDGTLDPAASGTLTIAMADQPGGASLGGTLPATINDGVATFNGLSIDQAGSGYALSVGGGAFSPLTSSAFAVTPAAASQLVVASEPAGSMTAGSSTGLTVHVEDAFGNLATGYGGEVTVALAGGPFGAGLDGSLSTSASGGVASFSGLSIDQAGTGYTIEATATGLSSATTDCFTVTPAAPSQLVIEAGPASSLAAGAAFGLTVSVEDPYGNLETSYGGELSVGLASGPAGAVLDGTSTESASGGVASFSGLDLTTAGSGYTLEATAAGLPSVESGAFAVTPAAPSQLVLTQQHPSTLTAGSPFGLAVSVEDAFGNLVTDSDATVALGLLGGGRGASLGGTTTAVVSGGVATFDGLTLDGAGSSYRIEASSPGLTGVTTADLSVSPASPARLVITAQPPASVTAGSGFGLGVSVEDAFGNPVSGYAGTVTVSLEREAGGTMLSGGTSLQATQGVATFSGLAIDQAGGDVLEVTADGVGSLSTTPLQVVPAAPSQLVLVDAPPTSLIAGQSFGLAAAVEDWYGNVATQFSGTVTATLAQAPVGGSLSGPVSVQAVNGIARFTGLALDKAGGGYAVEATSAGLTPAPSPAITVAPASPSRLVVTLQPPGRVVAGRPFAVGVEALDAYGNVATGFDGTVTAALAPGSGHEILKGDLSVPAHDGQALISDVVPKKIATSQAITITGSSLTPALTSVFDVTKAGPARIRSVARHLSRSPLMRHPAVSRRVRLDRLDMRIERPDRPRR
jgi:hypothetical protein